LDDESNLDDSLRMECVKLLSELKLVSEKENSNK